MPKSLPPLPLKQPQKTVVRQRPSPSSEDKPSYPGTDLQDELLPLPNTPEDIINAINALVELPESEQHTAWHEKSKAEMVRIMKHVKHIRVPWICIEAQVSMYNENNVFSRFTVNRQYEPAMEQPWNLVGVYGGAEIVNLLICGESFGNHYSVNHFDDDTATITKMESLPFPRYNNELLCPSSGDVNLALLNRNNEESRAYWKRLTVRQQTAFLQQCSQFELPWSAIRSEHFEMKRADGGHLWNGLFIPLHAECVNQLLGDHQDVYDHEEPPRFDGITIVLSEYDFHLLEGTYEITGSNPDYVSLERLSDSESDDDSFNALTQRM